MPLAMANVALRSIGAYFDASQTQLNLVAVGYSLGLACSVLWLGALGDRYGRKMMMVTGVVLAIPATLLAANAPTINVLIVARDLRWIRSRNGVSYLSRHDCGAVDWAGQNQVDCIVGSHGWRN